MHEWPDSHKVRHIPQKRQLGLVPHRSCFCNEQIPGSPGTLINPTRNGIQRRINSRHRSQILIRILVIALVETELPVIPAICGWFSESAVSSDRSERWQYIPLDSWRHQVNPDYVTVRKFYCHVYRPVITYDEHLP